MKKKIALIIVFGVLLLIQPLSAQTWGALKMLTGNSGDSILPDIAVASNDHIHMVWEDKTPGNDEIYYGKSTDGGGSWATKRLTWTSGFSGYPALAVDSNNHIHVVWADNAPGNLEIYYKKSTDGGGSWATKRLTWTSGNSAFVCIAIDTNNHIHVLWSDYSPGNPEMYYKRSTDGGVSWTAKRLTWNSGDSYASFIAVDSNDHIHVVWRDWTPGNLEIYYKRSTDGGASWTAKRLTWNSGKSTSPRIAIDTNNHFHVFWSDDTPGNFELFCKRSTDGGVSWTAKRLTWNSGSLSGLAIALDSSDYLHAVWGDDTPGNYEAYYRRSTDGGVSWTAKRLTWNSGDSWFPAVAIDASDNIHVVWSDDTPGNYEIYYRKGIQ